MPEDWRKWSRNALSARSISAGVADGSLLLNCRSSSRCGPGARDVGPPAFTVIWATAGAGVATARTANRVHAGRRRCDFQRAEENNRVLAVLEVIIADC